MSENRKFSNPRPDLDVLTLVLGGLQGFVFFGQFGYYLPGFLAGVAIWSVLLDLLGPE